MTTNPTIAEPESATREADHDVEKELELQRERSLQRQALDEGHDADVPSAEGYLLDERGELKRKQSIADQRLAHQRSHNTIPAGGDVEKEAGLAADKDDDAANASSEDEANIVWWDGENDPENPYNWPTWRKVVHCFLISALTFITPLASSIFAPGVPDLMAEFGSRSQELAAFVVSVYVLGFAFGPMLLAPLSEIYGRSIIYHVCNIGFICFIVGCALAPSLNTLIVFRFLSGVFGSAPLTNGGGSIADIIRQEKRASAMAGITIGPLLGPIIGPVAGGFLTHAKGWRWVFWVLAIISGVLTIAFYTMRESYAPILLDRKVKRLRKETGNDLLRSKLDIGLSPKDYFNRGIVRPFKMLVFSPIIVIFALYMAVVYGYLYLMFTSLTFVFTQYYGFHTDTVGLTFLGLGVGSMLGLVYYSSVSDRYLKAQAAKEGQGMKPEYRLQPMPIGAFLLPAGFFIYGWTAQYHIHWIVPLIGTAIIGVANLIIFMCLQMYLVDAFAMYAASALAANTVVRSIAGAVLPLCGLRMYDALGLGWGNSLLGFVALAMVPLPFIIQRWGEYLRTKPHPSQPNYAAAVGGSTHGITDDGFRRLGSSIKSVVDLLEAKGVSWGLYQEDMPYSGFEANWVNQQNGANDYVRKHNPLMSYDSVTSDLNRLAKSKNFTMFNKDLATNKLPQWMFITPNMTNDGHDTSVTTAGRWARNWLAPLLSNSNFNGGRTLIVLTFDEGKTSGTNQVYAALLGSAVPATRVGTGDGTRYNHYSLLKTAEVNWNLGNLGENDVGASAFF